MGSIKKAFDLTGKNALVTGGSRGLGLQIAEALGEQGARVVISSRKAPDLEKAQAHLAGLGIKADWIAADNSRDEDVKRLADETIKKLGRVDILVNNAGATWGAPTEDHPIEAWDKVMNLNIRSLFLLSQQIAKHSMIPQPSMAASSTLRRLQACSEVPVICRRSPTIRARARWSISRGRWRVAGGATESRPTLWRPAFSRQG